LMKRSLCQRSPRLKSRALARMVSGQMTNSRRMKQSLSLLFFTLLSLSAGASGGLALWYQQSAGVPMNEALPIGNGHLGGLELGTPEKERLVVNEDSLWTGDQNPSGDYDR